MQESGAEKVKEVHRDPMLVLKVAHGKILCTAMSALSIKHPRPIIGCLST